MSGILERVQETWTMEKAKRARKAETPKRPSPHLRSSAPALYSTPLCIRQINLDFLILPAILSVIEKRGELLHVNKVAALLTHTFRMLNLKRSTIDPPILMEITEKKSKIVRVYDK